MMVVIYKDDGGVIGVFPNARMEGKDVISNGKRVASGVNTNWAYVPDQDVSHLYKLSPEGELVLSARFPDDFILFTVEEKKQLIDNETEERINSQVHPFAPQGEQIGILRDQIARMLDRLEMEPTSKFKELNDIAAQAIAEGKEKKAQLLKELEGGVSRWS